MPLRNVSAFYNWHASIDRFLYREKGMSTAGGRAGGEGGENGADNAVNPVSPPRPAHHSDAFMGKILIRSGVRLRIGATSKRICRGVSPPPEKNRRRRRLFSDLWTRRTVYGVARHYLTVCLAQTYPSKYDWYLLKRR